MDFQTPPWCCELLAGMVRPGARLALEPTPGEGNLVRALNARGLLVTAPERFEGLDPLARFDVVVMNPPFSPMSLGYQIFDHCLTLAPDVIAVMPWLTLLNSDRRTSRLMGHGCRSVTHLPRSTFKGSRVQACVLEMSRDWRGKTAFRYAARPV